MDFLKFHINGKPILVRRDLIYGVIPPNQKGKKYALATADEHLDGEVDESFEDIEEALNLIDVEIMDVANND